MSNLLRTDGYKFSMAQAGFPLRRETFYLSFRKGGWQYIPFDLDQELRQWLLPIPEDGDQSYLDSVGYGLTGAMDNSVRMAHGCHIRTAPAGTWVYQREPIATIDTTSFPASWLEHITLRLFFSIQLSTEIKLHGANIDPRMLHCTCEEQAGIARRVIEAVGGSHIKTLLDMIVVDEDAYRAAVTEQAKKLIHIVGDPTRLFEVGMRAATCESQHKIALEALRELGIRDTSNVELAREIGMHPVGTMGHEHVQRWGNDLDAYRAMRDMRVGTPSYLLDTFDTITSGVPAAIRVGKEIPHTFAIRYDSGDKYGQYIYSHGEFKRHGLEPIHILEDGLTDTMTAKFEQLREFTGLSPEKQVYGYGGFFVSKCWDNPLTRDRVAAVYKLTQTSGEPRMKWGNEEGLGKISVPGNPVAWRRVRGNGPLSIIGQVGEEIPEDHICVTTYGTDGDKKILDQLRLCNVDGAIVDKPDQPYLLSPQTQALIASIERNK